MNYPGLRKKLEATNNSKHSQDNFSTLWSLRMLFLRLICFEGKTGRTITSLKLPCLDLFWRWVWGYAGLWSWMNCGNVSIVFVTKLTCGLRLLSGSTVTSSGRSLSLTCSHRWGPYLIWRGHVLCNIWWSCSHPVLWLIPGPGTKSKTQPGKCGSAADKRTIIVWIYEQ